MRLRESKQEAAASSKAKRRAACSLFRSTGKPIEWVIRVLHARNRANTLLPALWWS